MKSPATRSLAFTFFVIACVGGLVAVTTLAVPAWRQGFGVGICVALVALALSAGTSTRFRASAFTVWVFAVVAFALCFPELSLAWAGENPDKVIGHYVFVPLIQLIMFGMGMTLTFEDFVRVLEMPKAVLVGVVLQFSIMPLMGWAFASVFGLEPEVAVGLILVGSCPGGVASNVIVYLARANVALSVTMTAVSTLLSPFVTPLAMKLVAGTVMKITFFPMMVAILKMILVPVILGLLVNNCIHKFATFLLKILPIVSMLGICIIIGLTIALSRDKLLTVGLALLAASVCHNAAGMTLGYWAARLVGLGVRDARTVAIEVGIQNGGMASTLAINTLKSPVAALASATFGPWSAIAASTVASYWRKSTPDDLSDVEEVG